MQRAGEYNNRDIRAQKNRPQPCGPRPAGRALPFRLRVGM